MLSIIKLEKKAVAMWWHFMAKTAKEQLMVNAFPIPSFHFHGLDCCCCCLSFPIPEAI